MRRLIILLAIALVAASAAPAAGPDPTLKLDRIIHGRPVYATQCSKHGHCNRRSAKGGTFSQADSVEYALQIEYRGGEIFWATREGVQLIPIASGDYTHLVDPEGGGYIKIENATGLYLEHLSLGLETITYRGLLYSVDSLAHH